MPKLSIIILSFNTKERIITCLKSLFDQYKQQFEQKSFEIIVVDNNSKDDSVLAIKDFSKEKKYQIKLIENKENTGFASGCNLGASKSKGEYILFLNSDTHVINTRFLQMLSYFNQNKNFGIIGGQLQKEKGDLERSGGKFYSFIPATEMLLGLEKNKNLLGDKLIKIDWVSGGCMMVRKSIFENLKGFDEHFFMYLEDMEFCFRAKNINIETYLFPEVVAIHKEHGSSNRGFAIEQIYKSLLYFYQKHKTYLEYCILKAMLIIKALALISLGFLVGNSYLQITYKKALKVIL